MRNTNRAERRRRHQRGFSMLEALVALSLLIVALLSIAQLFVYTSRSASVARQVTLRTVLASEKLDQLRSLAWSYDAGGAPTGDQQTDITTFPERPTGGRGLSPSPPGSLDRNVDGYCDFLDIHGRPVGGGLSPPDSAVFVRRWSVAPLAAAPADGLAIQVRLVSREGAVSGRPAADVTLTTLRTRLAQ